MNFQEFFAAIFEFIKNLLKYLGEWPFPEEEEGAEEDTEAQA